MTFSALQKILNKILHDYPVYTIVCVAGVLLYAKTFLFGFTYLDDNVLILNNLPFLEDMGNLFNTFAHDVFFMMHGATSYYRPLLTISFMPEAILGKSLPFFYHFANVGIHLVAACLVYVLFAKLRYSRRIALLATFIFLVHPVLSQAVAWIPGRNDSLLAVFVLASFICLLDFIDRGGRERLWWSTGFFALALFTKETAIVMPFLFAGYLWLRGRFERDTLLELGSGWLITVLVWFSLRITAMINPLPMSLHDTLTSFWGNVPATLQLLGKAFFPFNLSVLPILQDTTFGWGYLAVALIIGLVLLQMRGKQTSRHAYLMLLFGFLWFLAFLLPSFIRLDTGVADFIEHRLYLPMIGLLIFLAESRLGRYLDTIGQKRFLQLSLPVLVLFCGITFVHEDVFADRLTFWQDAAGHSSHSPLAQKNLGAMYYLDQNYSLAEEYDQRALALNPEETMVHSNLGLIYAAEGKTKEAEQEYLKELSFNPYYDSAHYNLGLLYYGEGDYQNAKKQWEYTLYINPGYTDALQALRTLQAEGK